MATVHNLDGFNERRVSSLDDERTGAGMIEILDLENDALSEDRTIYLAICYNSR